jgi:carboxylate-amine ligase
MKFKPSDVHTIGIELELQLLDADSLDLADGIMPLMKFYPGSTNVKPEFIQNTVEVTTRICRSCDELAQHLGEITSDVEARCSELGMALCAAGTHPFCQRLALITPYPRYHQIEVMSGYLGQIQITFSTHVHIGIESGQQAIEVMDRLKAYIPLLIAISANSPFWRGHKTEFASYRHCILAAARSYGIPPTFDTWDNFVQFATTTRKAGIFETINDIHWDIRPRPHLGTIEVRAMDAQSTVSEAIALAAFVRALVMYLRDAPVESVDLKLPQPLPWWLEKENHFQASRKAMQANIVYTKDGKCKQLKDIWKQVIAVVRPIAEQSGDGHWLDQLQVNINNGP